MSSLTYLAAAAGTADVQLRSAPVEVRGLSARETVGASAEFVLRDGTGPTDPGVVHITLDAKESVTFWFERDDGVAFTHGLYLDRVSGTTELSVWV